MGREDIFQRVKTVYDEIRRLREENGSPAVDCCLREMEVPCFVALTYLGDTERLFPEEE
ncbi:MAG: hypothetical protein Q8R28_21515 [Dehalococcoidia bacterium]|nr:hypothetical protein [Dehalococcoidia bacterium]MDP2663303.1 hypothetical protein [Dehalococcoidia bacterium]